MTILDIKAVDEAVKKAIEKLDIMYLDKEEREIYENDLKRLRVHKAELKTAERKGREEGIDIGKDRKELKVAEKMVKRGDGVEDIVEIKELPKQKLNLANAQFMLNMNLMYYI